jgi:hypothetical protein
METEEAMRTTKQKLIKVKTYAEKELEGEIRNYELQKHGPGLQGRSQKEIYRIRAQVNIPGYQKYANEDTYRIAVGC